MAQQFQTGQELRVMEIRTKRKGGTFEITEVQREPQSSQRLSCSPFSSGLPCSVPGVGESVPAMA